MRRISIFVFFTSLQTLAIESEISFSKDDLLVSENVQRASSNDGKIIIAANVLQLQIANTDKKCELVLVDPTNPYQSLSDKITFKVIGETCRIIPKDKSCDPGYVAKNMAHNQNNPADEIIGHDKVKVCIKDTTAATQPTSAR